MIITYLQEQVGVMSSSESLDDDSDEDKSYDIKTDYGTSKKREYLSSSEEEALREYIGIPKWRQSTFDHLNLSKFIRRAQNPEEKSPFISLKNYFSDRLCG